MMIARSPQPYFTVATALQLAKPGSLAGAFQLNLSTRGLKRGRLNFITDQSCFALMIR